jgi:hypothetical protein
MLLYQFQRLYPVRGFPDHPYLRVLAYNKTKALPQYRVIISEDNGDYIHLITNYELLVFCLGSEQRFSNNVQTATNNCPKVAE